MHMFLGVIALDGGVDCSQSRHHHRATKGQPFACTIGQTYAGQGRGRVDREQGGLAVPVGGRDDQNCRAKHLERLMSYLSAVTGR